MNKLQVRFDKTNIILGALILLFIALAMQFCARSYWDDELISIRTLPINIVANPFLVGVTTNLPMFFYALKVWALVFPQEPTVFFRLLPLGFSICTLCVWWWFLRRKIGVSVAIIFGLLFVTAPIEAYYATELRPYSLTQLLLSLQFMVLYALISKMQMKRLALFVILTVLVLLTHYSAYFFVASEGLVLLFLWFYQALVKHKNTKTGIVFGISISLLLLIGFVSYRSISSSSMFFDSVESLSTSSNLSPDVIFTDILRVKEVFTNYYWFGLYYYLVDISVQFVIKKFFLMMLIGTAILLFVKRNDINTKFIQYSSAILLFSLLGTLILENLGYYPFGGRHIMPYAVFYYVSISYFLSKLINKAKAAVLLPIILAILFIFFNLGLNCAVSLSSTIPMVRLYEYCVFK